MSPSLFRFISVLRTLIAVVALMTFGNALQCFMNSSFLRNRMYTRTTDDRGLTSRIVGTWTLMTAIIRFCCAIDIYNKPVYGLTVLSFFLGLVHLTAELFYYKTTDLVAASYTQLAISGVSLVGMCCAYFFLDKSRTVEANAHIIEDSQRKKLSKFMKYKIS